MSRPGILLLAGLGLAAAGCSPEGPAQAPRSADVAAVVEMTNTFAFAPDPVTITAGGTVEWRNTSLMTHTVTADPAKVKDPSEISLPQGAAPFDSGEIARGQVWRQTFTVPGTYQYICRPHDWAGMTGVIEVTP